MQNEGVQFSIVVPVYNTKEDLVLKCISSIESQTYGDFECIIIDDGSEINCSQFLDLICKRDQRIRVIHLEHNGNSYARNHGVSIAIGKYLMFVDSDDIISPYVFEEANNLINAFNPDMVMGLVKAYDGRNISFNEYSYYKQDGVIAVNGREQIGDIFEHILGYRSSRISFKEGYISGGPVAKIIKTELARISPFPGGDLLTEDVIWNCVMMSNLETAVITSNLWYGYYHYAGSKSRKFYSDGAAIFDKQILAYYDNITKYWPGRRNGLYIKLWQEIAMYFRTYLADSQEKWIKRYKCYKEIFSRPEYIEMLHSIDFSYERNVIKRMMKEFTLYLIRYRLYFPTWFIWKNVSGKSL